MLFLFTYPIVMTSVPLKETEVMTIGYVKRKSIQLSELAQLYVNELAKYKKLVLK